MGEKHSRSKRNKYLIIFTNERSNTRLIRLSHSYIYDPSDEVDGRKMDSSSSSLYHPHHLSGGAPGADPLGHHGKQKQGFNNLGFSKAGDSTLKLEVDNNQLNYRVHGAPPTREVHRQASAPPAEVYIIQPESLGPRWVVQDKGPSQVPVYPNIQGYQTQTTYGKTGHHMIRNGWDGSTGRESLSADEVDEGVGGTPEYMGDTGDEGSVLSVDIHTSNTSLSSVDTRDGLRLPKTPDVSTVESGISVMKSEDEEEFPKEEGEAQSITDSMVAEALAALEAATAGEDME